MRLHKLFLTQNNCYRKGGKHTVRKIMMHSTGAKNKKLSRYVGPDDGILGKNPYNNHWNTPKPGGRSVCVHAFIGEDKNGTVRTYQTLPWNMPAWHAGGKANNLGYIGYEIQEGDNTDRDYFNRAYQEAIELNVYLCKMYGLTEKDIIDHAEGHKQGIASNHGDVMSYFKHFGKSMNTVRSDVKKLLNSNNSNGSEVYYSTKNNANDEYVTEIQRQLKTLGYPILVRGGFGPQMEEIIKQFQKDNRLSVDGLAGPSTLNKIKELINKPVMAYGSRGAEVNKLQQDLKELNYNITVGGAYGKKTENTVKQFQKDFKLEVNGKIYKEALNKIKSLLNIKEEADSLYKVNAGAFNVKANAEKRVKELKEKGFEGYITKE